MTFELPHGEDDELVTAMVTRLRKLHVEGKSNAASFQRTVQMLRGHTEGRANASAEWFREVLDAREADVERILKTSMIGLSRQTVDAAGNVVSNEAIQPDETFWDWVYGVYLHDDEDKLERVEEWKLLPVHQFIFLQIATNLARAYFAFTGIVREVLDEPALV
jgi:hypothetical protein